MSCGVVGDDGGEGDGGGSNGGDSGLGESLGDGFGFGDNGGSTSDGGGGEGGGESGGEDDGGQGVGGGCGRGGGGVAIPLIAFDNGRTECVLPMLSSEEQLGEGLCCRLQLPIGLGYALTVHKSQGTSTPRLLTATRAYPLANHCHSLRVRGPRLLTATRANQLPNL